MRFYGHVAVFGAYQVCHALEAKHGLHGSRLFFRGVFGFSVVIDDVRFFGERT